MIKSPNNQDPKARVGEHPNSADEFPLREYSLIVWRGKWVILAILLLVVGLVALYTFTREPVYEASALVLINEKGPRVPITTPLATSLEAINKLTNELEILKSNANTRATAEALIEKKFCDDRASVVLPIIQADVEQLGPDSIADIEVIAERLLGILDFEPVRESDVIRINARSTNPKEAALIANTCLEVYTSRNVTTSRLQSSALREFLESQLESTRSSLSATEDALQHYMNRSGVVSLDAEASALVEQLSQLEAQRDALEVERSSGFKTLMSYKQELARQQPDAVKAIGQANDSYIRLLQEQLAQLEVQRDVTIAQNPTMVGEQLYSARLREINGQIEVLRQRLTERTQAFVNSMLPGGEPGSSGNATFLADFKQKIIEQQIALDGLDTRIDAMNGVIAQYERRFNQIPGKSMDLAKLQRDRLSSEKLFLLVEEKYNEAAIEERSEFGYITIIDPAIVPTRPVSPVVVLNLGLACLTGLVLGIGVVFVRAFSDVHIRTPEDLKKQGLTPLSSIGVMNGEVKKIKKGIRLKEQYKYKAVSPSLVTLHRRLAPISESYRHLRTNIQHLQEKEPLKWIVVTSAHPRDGKSTTAANLAISFSQGGKRVLLVDADLRHSNIHELFGLKLAGGLSDHLLGKAGLDGSVHKNVLPDLDIVTCGMAPCNPADILGSEQMKAFIEQTKREYDLILSDTPPLLAATDAVVLASGADGVLVVALAGKTEVDALASVTELLDGVGAKLLGVVLNGFDVRDSYRKHRSGFRHGYYGYESGYY